MRVIGIAAILWCILFMTVNASAEEEPVWGARPAVKPDTREEPAAPRDSAAVSRFQEAEPALLMAERERPRASVIIETPRKGIRFMVNALLLIIAVFTGFSFLGMRKPGGTGFRKESARRPKKGRKSRGTPSARKESEPGAERERPPRSPRERAESLNARRIQIAAEIDRLMKRV